MSNIQEKIPRDKFEKIFRPMIRALGSRNVILRLNEAAQTAIPRQTKLAQLMPKLETLCYERNRPKAEEELDRLWDIYFENRIEDHDQFSDLSDELNEHLEDEKVSEDKDKRAAAKKVVHKIVAFLEESDFNSDEVEAVFRFKAYPDVLDLFLEEYPQE
jgi:hypothetical protein